MTRRPVRSPNVSPDPHALQDAWRVGGRQPNLLDELIGERLKLRRSMLGLSQEEVAGRCNVSAQQYYKYEAGLSRLAVSRLVQLANAFNAPVSWFLEGIEMHPEMPDDLAGLIEDAEAIEMLLLFNQIQDPAMRNSMLAMARQYVAAVGDEDTA